MPRLLCVIVVAVALGWSVPSVKADKIVGNLDGSTLGTTSTSSQTIVGSALGVSAAVEFTPGANYIFTGAQVALFSSSIALAATVDPFLVRLTTDSGGAPGSVLEQISIAISTLSLYSVVSSLNPTLDAGTAYWLVVSADSTDSGGWMLNSTGDVSSGTNEATFAGSGPWSSAASGTRPAFEIDGTPVPEPNTLLLVALGLAGLALARRCRLSLAR